MTRTIALLVLLAGFAILAACNTVRGVGQDIEAAGKGIQRTTR